MKAKNKILGPRALKKFVEAARAEGKKIVFTNGCFDILHVGHVRYLQKSKSFADYLIVLLNSDKSVKSIKGDDRPINNEMDRAEILVALNCVDFVVLFSICHLYFPLSKISLANFVFFVIHS